jgi:endonuclease/exonuclease/phosphatase family metal-dependent hydrolase
MVKLVCYNIEYCEGIDGLWYQYLMFWKLFFPPKNLDKKIVEALNRLHPDILALVEVDTGSFRAKKDEVIFFEKKLGLKYFIEKIKYPLSGWTKLFHHVPILNKQANAIISKYPLTKTKYHLLNEGTKKVVIESTVHCPKPVTLLLAHLALGKKTRKKQLKELIRIVNEIKNPVILMGDFNTTKGDGEIKELLAKTHLNDKFLMDKQSLGLTYPSWHPRKRLDYVLTSKDLIVKRYAVLNFPFSDHMPLLVEFDFKKS